MIALRRDQRAEGRETGKASTPIGPGRDAIAKSVMVSTATPPDYCDYGVQLIVQDASPGVNFYKKKAPLKDLSENTRLRGLAPMPPWKTHRFAIPTKLCYSLLRSKSVTNLSLAPPSPPSEILRDRCASFRPVRLEAHRGDRRTAPDYAPKILSGRRIDTSRAPMQMLIKST